MEIKEKYKTFSTPIKEEVKKIDKDGNESLVAISYKVTLIDSAILLIISQWNLQNQLKRL